MIIELCPSVSGWSTTADTRARHVTKLGRRGVHQRQAFALSVDRDNRYSNNAFEQLVAIKRKRAHIGRDQS